MEASVARRSPAGRTTSASLSTDLGKHGPHDVVTGVADAGIDHALILSPVV